MSGHFVYISGKNIGSAGVAERNGTFCKGGSFNGWRFRARFI